MVNLLVIGIDPALRDASSASAKRQQRYYKGMHVTIVVLCTGDAYDYKLSTSIRVVGTGGQTKAHAFIRGWLFARKYREECLVTAQDLQWTGLMAWLVSSRGALYTQDHSGLFARTIRTPTERMLLPLSKYIARSSCGIRTVSERGARGLRDIGVSADRIDVLPIAVDPTAFYGLSPQKMQVKHALCIARLEWEKGIDLLIEAWAKVIARYPDAVLRIVGDGTQAASYKLLVRRCGVAKSVEFCGVTTAIAEQFAWASMYVQPSRFEGWGMAVVEAVYAHCPVVMTDVGCAGEIIIHEQSGLVCSSSPEGLAACIQCYLEHPNDAQRFAARAYAIAEQLPSLDLAAEQVRSALIKAYERTR